jgi:adenylate cyclase
MRSALSVTMIDIEAIRLKKEHPTNPDAFDLALQARMALIDSHSAAASSEALRLSELALKKDPNSVGALTTAAFALTDGIYFETIPRAEALDRAAGYVERARRIQPDNELVMNAEAALLDFQHHWNELLTIAQQITQMFPNNWLGFQRLGVANKNLGRYEAAIPAFQAALRLDPRASTLSNRYWNLAHCAVPIGRDSEAIVWAHRALTSPGDLTLDWRQRIYVWLAVAYQRTGDAAAARNAVAEALRLQPFDTVRAVTPDNPDSPESREQFGQIWAALRQAGYRDHADPDADFGIASDNLLHALIQGHTPTEAPGARTVRTADVVAMLADRKPLVLDTMWNSWHLSIAGAVGLDGIGFGGVLSDPLQARLDRKMRALTGGDLTRPIVVMGFNSERFDGRNLTLRLAALGYTQLYWYRGGREAWEVAALPEVDIQPAEW